jgi:hypothetical protein
MQRLRNSAPATFAVARHLHAKGFTVTIPAFRFAPSADEAPAYADDGDLFAIKDETRHRIEIKGLSFDFTSRADWPHQHFFVSSVSSIEKMKALPSAWFHLSQDMHHAAIVWKKTRPQWYVDERMVKGNIMPKKNWCCPLDLIEFRSLDPDEDF